MATLSACKVLVSAPSQTTLSVKCPSDHELDSQFALGFWEDPAALKPIVVLLK